MSAVKAADHTTRDTWKLWGVSFVAFMLLVIAGGLLLPPGVLHDFWWPIIAGVLVTVLSLSFRHRRR